MTLAIFKDIAVIASTIVAVVTLIKAVIEYTRQNAQKRADHYQILRDKFRNDEQIHPLFELLESNSNELESIPLRQKQHLIGFYEDIALSVNSGLLKKEVAHYMFSYYALRCWESDHFWLNVNRDSPYWALFRNFVEQMKSVENKLISNVTMPSKFRL